MLFYSSDFGKLYSQDVAKNKTSLNKQGRKFQLFMIN